MNSSTTSEIMCNILRLRIQLHEQAIETAAMEEDVEFREKMIRGLYNEINYWRSKP